MRENSPEVLPAFPAHVVVPTKPKKPKVRKVEPTTGRDISPALRAAAAHIEKYGFSIFLGGRYRPACFLGSISTAIESGLGVNPYDWIDHRTRVLGFLQQTIFEGHPNFTQEHYLSEHRWNQQDAVAALTIAADIAEVYGR